MRDFIISEIKRLAAETGAPPGEGAFTRATGVTSSKWRGVIWLRWGEALAEAGFAPNEWNQKRDTRDVLERVAVLCRSLGRLPTYAEYRMQKRSDPAFPTYSSLSTHFGTTAGVVSALRQLAAENEAWSDLKDFLPEEIAEEARRPDDQREGMVYLLKSGKHYKIGRSDDIERRFREVKIALPESVTLIHAIRTDDPSGIEAYWHRRFSDKRANGEWFALRGEDVRAFRKRTFQ